MSEMVERVARALCSAKGRDPDRKVEGDRRLFAEREIEDGVMVPDDILFEPMWMAHQREARAAIAAMREPTEAMTDHFGDWMGDAPKDHETARELWREAIDTALGTEP